MLLPLRNLTGLPAEAFFELATPHRCQYELPLSLPRLESLHDEVC